MLTLLGWFILAFEVKKVKKSCRNSRTRARLKKRIIYIPTPILTAIISLMFIARKFLKTGTNSNSKRSLMTQITHDSEEIAHQRPMPVLGKESEEEEEKLFFDR
jgi:hypothetical protein